LVCASQSPAEELKTLRRGLPWTAQNVSLKDWLAVPGCCFTHNTTHLDLTLSFNRYAHISELGIWMTLMGSCSPCTELAHLTAWQTAVYKPLALLQSLHHVPGIDTHLLMGARHARLLASAIACSMLQELELAVATACFQLLKELKIAVANACGALQELCCSVCHRSDIPEGML
jgi:hypothetical protein